MPYPTIHVWSDYVCPFCLISDEVLERALRDVPGARVEHHPFELRPRPTPTLRPEDPYLPSVWTSSVYPMARRYDVQLRLPSVSPQPYTDTAFHGAQYATDRGGALAYHRRLLRAFFVEDHDVGDREVLGDLAADIGLDRAGYLEALDNPAYARRHQRALAEARDLEITAVPTLFIGQRRINGVADPGVLLRALQAEVA